MEAYNSPETRIYNAVSKTRSWISATLGILVTLLGVGIIFVIASLEGTREVSASNVDSAKILSVWREQHRGEHGGNLIGFPEEKSDIIEYNGREYYFVIDEMENGEIIEWHFAYDGGIEYVYKDFKYWVLTFIVLVVSLFVADVNYKSTSKATKQTSDFKGTLKYYQDNKEKVKPYTQYLSAFCIYKNKQEYEKKKQEIVEEAGLSYAFYNSELFKYDELESWQKKALEKIKYIKIERLRSQDLLQEQGFSTTKISFLPMSENKHHRHFILSGVAQKILTSALSGFVVSFGVILGNWTLGLVYGFVILLSAITAVFVSTDYVSNTLRNRFISKADLLNEFYNMKEKFIEEENQVINGKKDNNVV